MKRAKGCERFHAGAPWLLPATALVALLAGACGSGDGAITADIVVHDSAGVVVVENPGDLWSLPERWTLSDEPLVSIGLADGAEPYLLDGVRGVVPLGDGRVLVANSGDRTLRWYDADGEFLFQRGGEGGGPGEFDQLGGVALGLADTIMAVDWSARRLSVFTSDGTLAGTRPIQGLTGPPGSVYRLPDGSMVTGVSGFSTAQLGDDISSGRVRLDSPLLRLSADGTGVDTIGMFPGEDIQIMVFDQGMWFGGAVYGKRMSYASSGEAVYVGTQDAFVIDVYSPAGQLVRSIRALETPVLSGPNLRADWNAFTRERLADVPPQERAEAERDAAQTELPASAPAYAEFVTDDEGNLWVAEYRVGGSAPERWVVFNAEGRVLTTVAVPESFRIMAVRQGRVFGRSSDEWGVQRVVGYALGKG